MGPSASCLGLCDGDDGGEFLGDDLRDDEYATLDKSAVASPETRVL